MLTGAGGMGDGNGEGARGSREQEGGERVDWVRLSHNRKGD